MIEWLETVWRHTAHVGVGPAVTALVALVGTAPLARRARLPVPGVAAWLVVLGLIGSLTLSPRTTRRPMAERVCTLDGWALPDLHSFLVLDQRAANVALLVPLAVLSALPRDRRLAAAGLGLAAALPFVVEGVQYAVPALARVCHSDDLVDNLLGVVVGAAVGLTVRAAVGRRRQRPDRPGVPQGDPAVVAGR